MWTHKRPFKPLLPTSTRISYHAETELFRSLNKNRLIAFVGSGVTLPYGRLTWSELCTLLILDIDDYFWEVFKKTDSQNRNNFKIEEARSIHNTLRNILDQKSITKPEYKKLAKSEEKPLITPTIENPLSADPTILELCSELGTLLDLVKCGHTSIKSNFLKEQASEYLTQGPLNQFKSRLGLIEGRGNDSLYGIWERTIEDLLKNRALSEKEEEKPFKEQINNLLNDNSSFFNDSWLTQDKTAFTRFALEEKTWEEMSKIGDKPEELAVFFKSLFRILEVASLKDAQIKQKSQLKGNSWGDPIATIANTLNINRIVTLNYDTELEKHYIQKKGFKAKKNDPLLFTTTQNNRNEHVAIRKNGFGAMLTSVALEKNTIGKLVNFAASSKNTDAYIFHLHGRADCPTDLILTEKDYQELYVKSSGSRTAFSEGVDTLFGGNDVLFLGVGMNEADLLQPLRQFVSESSETSLKHKGILAILSEQYKLQINTILTVPVEESEINNRAREYKALKLNTEFGVKTIFYKPNTLLQTNVGNFLKCKIKKTKSGKRKSRIELMLNSRQMIRNQSIAFVNKLEKLARSQKEWWNDWVELPGNRTARYTNYNEVNDTMPHLWVRQKVMPVNSNNYKPKYTIGTYKEILEKIKLSVNNKSSARTILRYSGSTGIGKGSLVNALQDYFEGSTPIKIKVNYAGYFFSDAKFSTEYTSVISALSRFIADIYFDKVKIDPFNKIQVESELQKILELSENDKLPNNYLLPAGKTEILKYYLNLFQDKQEGLDNDEKQKIFICLSGLDRLVDKRGYAFNALHRDFFKVLTRPNNKSFPLTILLISDQPEVPIRYLSEPIANTFAKDNQWILQQEATNGSSKLDAKLFKVSDTDSEYLSQSYKLKKWNTILKTKIEDRTWLPSVPDVKRWQLSDEPDSKRWHPILIYGPNESDRQLGILPVNGSISRKSLAKIADEHLSIHIWLRLLLLNLIKENLQPDSGKGQAILDTLDLAASRKDLNGVNGVVDSLLNEYDQLESKDSKDRPLIAYQTILRHLSLFSVPVERAVLANCPKIIESIFGLTDKPSSERKIAEELEHYLGKLHSAGMIIKMDKSGSIVNEKNVAPEVNFRYMLTSIMREHLAKRMDYDAYVHGEYSFFDVTLYPTQPLDLPSPKESDFVFIGGILQNIINNARSSLKLIEEKIKKEKGEGEDNELLELDSRHSVSRMIRAAVNLINGSFSIGVISRLENASFNNIEYYCGHALPFEAYRRWLRCLSNLAVRIKTLNSDLKNKIQEPLYETESAWIYNEQAVVCLIQGRVFDSLKASRQAKELLNCFPWVDPNDTSSYPSHTSLRRVELNYAIALLEFGMIKEAEDKFYKLYRRKELEARNKTSLTAHLACGYLGLCYHLQGRMSQAEDRYKEALEFFKEENKNYLRVTAIFRHNYGNLQRSLNNYDKAEIFINLAVDAAACAKQMDIFHHASVSKAKLLLAKSEKGFAAKAIKLLNNAGSYAEKMGIYRLQVHADIVRGEVLMAQNQNAAAGSLLVNAIALSNRHGMRLMKRRALEVYGKALLRRGEEKQVTDDILNTAKMLAENTGHLMRWNQESED